MSVLGTRVLRTEDPAFLTTGGTYVADLRDPLLDGAAHVTFVRSTMAHARLLDVDVTDALDLPGVVGVFTAADLEGLAEAASVVPRRARAMARPWLATDRVRFVGEAVAVVVTERPEQGEDAAEAVVVDYDPLEAVVDPEQALAGAPWLFPEAGTNVAFEIDFDHPDEDLFAGCEVVVRQRLINQRLAACPLETRAAAATWTGGDLVVWLSTQSVHGARRRLAAAYGLDESRIRVIAPDVGGGFGAKIAPQADELVLPWVARRVGRPVRWVEHRSDNFVAAPHGRAQINTVEIGGRRDGTIEAYRLDVLQDAGAYPQLGATLPFLTRMMTTGVYDIGRADCRVRSVVTTTTVVEAYRGAGRPEATHAIERAVDLFAAEIGMDPAEVRRRNLVPADAFPYTTAVGTTYDCGDYAGALDRVLDAADYAGLRAEQARRRAADDPVQLGIGLAAYVEITAGPGPGEEEYARVSVGPDGRVTVATGSSPHGQGHHTSWRMIVRELTGVDLSAIDVVHGDTAVVPEGTGTFGSRSLQVGGMAVHRATSALVERARWIAARLLEADPSEVVLDPDTGTFRVPKVPGVTRSWAEVASAAAELPFGGTLEESTTFATEAPTFPFGVHLAVVEVDTETGAVRLVRFVACDDAGTVINPVVVEGQRHGGIAQGVAQALTEVMVYDADGNPLTRTFADYGIPSAAELPRYELVPMETPTPLNDLGAKGIGESGTIGATPAVHNAVVDALAPLGVRHIDLPLTPERVWQAVAAARVAGGGRTRG